MTTSRTAGSTCAGTSSPTPTSASRRRSSSNRSTSPGSLAGIAQVIGENDGNIDNIKMIRKGEDAHEMAIDLEVFDLKHLNRIIAQLRARPTVSTVSRVNG